MFEAVKSGLGNSPMRFDPITPKSNWPPVLSGLQRGRKQMSRAGHMRLSGANLGRLFAISVLLLMCFADANASSNAGIEIELGKFKLSVYYSVALDYYDEADKAIRDPRVALFTLASVAQANSGALAAINHTIYVDLYTRDGVSGSFLKITEDPQTRSIVLRDMLVGQDITKEILKTICDRYADTCKRPASNTLYLYRCQKDRCPGQIRFGSFPSESINKSFGLLRPKREGVAPISVTRNNIGQYFEELE